MYDADQLRYALSELKQLPDTQMITVPNLLLQQFLESGLYIECHLH